MKKKLLYATPLFPKQSGISDYSEALIPYLSEYFDLHILIDKYELHSLSFYDRFKIIQYEKDMDFSSYEIRLYNFGNNPYFHAYIYEIHLKCPGFIILHDFILYYLYAGYYGSIGSLLGNIYSESIRAGDLSGFFELKYHLKKGGDVFNFSKPELLPLNREVIDLSQGVFVHSQFALNRVNRAYPGKSCFYLPMIAPRGQGDVGDASACLKVSTKYGIRESDFVFSSLGFIARTKQNDLICGAFAKLDCLTFKYLMIGEGNFADAYLSDRIVKTGFVEQIDYDCLLLRSDIVLNLRYPSMGETSISLIHAMSFGKVCVVTDDAWFSELPTDVVVKVSPHITECELVLLLNQLVSDESRRKAIGSRAREYVYAHHSAENLARQISHDVDSLKQ